MMSDLLSGTIIVVAGALGLLLFPHGSDAREIEGAWELVSYQLEGEAIPVSGLLVLADGRFAMIYSMAPDGQHEFGRAHAGSYAVEQNRLIFDVRLWIQKTESSAGVVPGTVVGVDLERRDEALILRFDGGSVQEFRPLERREGALGTGSWSSQGDGSDGVPGRGAFIASANWYVLLQLDEDAGTGQAYGGSVGTGARLDATWSIAVDGDTGNVMVGDGLPDLRMTRRQELLSIGDDAGNRLEFRSR